MSLDCIILGAPGAGKGTQAQVLSRLWRVPHISTGGMLRDAVRSASELGQRVAPIMAAGGLIDDNLMRDVVVDRLQRSDARIGFILDGYPRTLAQAGDLDALSRDRGPLLVINIIVSDARIVERLASRRTCAACGEVAHVAKGAACGRCGGAMIAREDDRVDVVRRRLEVYHRQTAPLVHYYAARPTFWSVDGSRPPADVTAEILRSVDGFKAVAV